MPSINWAQALRGHLRELQEGFYSVGNFAAGLQDQPRPSCARWKGLVLGTGFLLSYLLLGTGDRDH